MTDTSRTAVPGRLRLALLLGAFVALGPLTIDMYLPALPQISSELNASDSLVQLTLTGTLAGLALGQLFIGPLSDAIGRRRPLFAGALLHLVASLLVLIAPNIEILGVLRVLQGIGTAAGAVVALAIVRDLYVGRDAANLLSRLMLVMGAAPVLAPTIGGGILHFTDWRGVFVVLAVYAALLLPLAWKVLPETLPVERRRSARIGETFRTYGGLLRDRVFVGLVLVAGFTMAALFGYVSGASFVYQEQFGLGQQMFGLVFGAGAIWLIAGTQFNPVLLRRWDPRQILSGAAVAGSVAGVVLIAVGATGVGGLVGILVPMWAVLAAAGVMLPNAPAVALSKHGEAAGTAAALLGAVQFGVGAAVSPLVGALGNDALAMTTVVAGGMFVALLVLVVVVRPWGLPDLEDGQAPARSEAAPAVATADEIAVADAAAAGGRTA
ncbi:multidrug effflux MFS transporter [Pseudonocardia sp. N23]|uniref:multidrug effflux MFS transporter n=1 Tax=Pseudonocardia sp. N23 TaxID=1987376 RepID=UPI000BFD8405|nr:multidrug effflux MFS transporter [Pseudonocardia sp. N23]GAY08821.1 multidrug resistance transporter, Bcr/CflA family [Pseudonocardia sp. N23]